MTHNDDMTQPLTRGWIVAGCLAGVLVLMILSILHQRAHDGLPVAVFLAPAEASFGTVKDRETAEGECELVNNTDHAVKVVETTSSCGCLRVALSAVEIAPGGKAKVVLTASLKGKHGKQAVEARAQRRSSAPAAGSP